MLSTVYNSQSVGLVSLDIYLMALAPEGAENISFNKEGQSYSFNFGADRAGLPPERFNKAASELWVKESLKVDKPNRSKKQEMVDAQRLLMIEELSKVRLVWELEIAFSRPGQEAKVGLEEREVGNSGIKDLRVVVKGGIFGERETELSAEAVASRLVREATVAPDNRRFVPGILTETRTLEALNLLGVYSRYNHFMSTLYDGLVQGLNSWSSSSPEANEEVRAFVARDLGGIDEIKRQALSYLTSAWELTAHSSKEKEPSSENLGYIRPITPQTYMRPSSEPGAMTLDEARKVKAERDRAKATGGAPTVTRAENTDAAADEAIRVRLLEARDLIQHEVTVIEANLDARPPVPSAESAELVRHLEAARVLSVPNVYEAPEIFLQNAAQLLKTTRRRNLDDFAQINNRLKDPGISLTDAEKLRQLREEYQRYINRLNDWLDGSSGGSAGPRASVLDKGPKIPEAEILGRINAGTFDQVNEILSRLDLDALGGGLPATAQNEYTDASIGNLRLSIKELKFASGTPNQTSARRILSLSLMAVKKNVGGIIAGYTNASRLPNLAESEKRGFEETT